MFATGTKKMLNMLILDILKEYSDERHRLTQQDIIRLLELNYGMLCDRRSVKNNIISLQDMEYEIVQDTGYYLANRDFEDAELRMLIDSVLFSKSVSQEQARQLIEKLKKYGNKYFSAKVPHISNLPCLQHSDNKQIMYTLDVINEAIVYKKKISFIYNDYGIDFELYPRRKELYIVNPFQMVANNGKYYLVGNYDKYDNISHYRIDRMSGVKILDAQIKSMKEVKELSGGFDLPKHMAEHIYMFRGESINVKFITTVEMMNELIDWFGRDFRVRRLEDQKQIEVSVFCNELAMFYWALQYGPYVEVKEPESLRKSIRDNISEMMKKYQ